MGIENLLMIILGIAVAVIGYFLKNVIDEVKSNEKEINDLRSDELSHIRTDLRILENDTKNKQDFILEKIDNINSTIRDLVVELKVLSRYLTKKEE